MLWAIRRYHGDVLEAERYLGRARTSGYKILRKLGLQDELKAIRAGQ